MSEPNRNVSGTDRAHAAILELVGAQSALNMQPSPIETPVGDYLADVDKQAAHAYDHICAAIDILREA